MERLEIERRVNAVIEQTIGADMSDATNETELAGLGADSLDVVECIMEIEKEFSITIPDTEAEKAKTLGALYEVVQETLKTKGE